LKINCVTESLRSQSGKGAAVRVRSLTGAAGSG
jgi:hypothetical protein